MKKVLIVGCGISGATCARLLADKFKVTIILRAKVVGGNCYDFLSDDHSCYIHKYGPHIFHTLNKDVWLFVNRYSLFNNYHHCVYTKANGLIFTFPINLSVLSQLFKTHLYSKLLVLLIIHDVKFDHPKNFELAAINAVGTRIYLLFIKNYTRKQWRCDPVLLPVLIFNRIDIRYNFNNDYFPNQYQGQPKYGYTNLIKNLIDHENILLILNQDFLTFVPKDYYDVIIYSGSLKGLLYRSIKFDYYTSKYNNGFSVLNLPQHETVTRVTNYNLLHRVNSDATVFNYCLLIPVNNNELNLLYPIYNEKNLTLYNDITNEMKLRYPNIRFIGRLGLYKYLDIDKAIEYSFDLANLLNKVM